MAGQDTGRLLKRIDAAGRELGGKTRKMTVETPIQADSIYCFAIFLNRFLK